MYAHAHHHSYSYAPAPQYLHYPPTLAHHPPLPHSAPPFATHYPPQQLHPPVPQGVYDPGPHYLPPQPLYQQPYDQPAATFERQEEALVSLRRPVEDVASPESHIGDEEDDEYIPGAESTSRARPVRKKAGGKKKAGSNGTSGKVSKARGGAGARVLLPVLVQVPTNLPDVSSVYDPDAVPPAIQRRLKNFSGTLLAYPPGTSLDINNLLIVIPAPTEGVEEDEYEKYTCRVCSKTYAGRNARSVARRHLQDKHNVPLSAQPRRSRWEREPNRPKTQEEARERNLDQKRTWAKNYRERIKDQARGDLFTHSPQVESRGSLDGGHAGAQRDVVEDEPMPGSEFDAEGEIDEDVPMTAGMGDPQVDALGAISPRLVEGTTDAPLAQSATQALESPVRLDKPRPETPLSSPPAPPNTAQWLHSISSTALSTQGLLDPAAVPFGATSAPLGVLHPPFVLLPISSGGTEAFIERLSATSPTPPPVEERVDEEGEEYLISVADSLLNMHSTPITSPKASSRKVFTKGIGVKLHFSPIKPRSRATSDSWNLTLEPAPSITPQTDAAGSAGESALLPQSVGNTPTWQAHGSSLAVRPRPIRTRSLIQPLVLASARPGALGRSMSFSKLDDPFTESPRLPVASSPIKEVPPCSSPTDTSSVSEHESKRIAVSFDPASFSPASAAASNSSTSPTRASNSFSSATPAPERVTTATSSAKPYDSSSSSLLFSSSAMKVPLSALKTPLSRRAGIPHHAPPTVQNSIGRDRWMFSSPAQADTANELGLAPDHYTSQTPGYLRWVQETPGSVIRRKAVALGGRRVSGEEDSE